MLMMSRREGESILIGDDIEIVIAQIGRSRVKLGIRAPRETLVVAREIKVIRDQNLAAAQAAPASYLSPQILERIRTRLFNLSREVRDR